MKKPHPLMYNNITKEDLNNVIEFLKKKTSLNSIA